MVLGSLALGGLVSLGAKAMKQNLNLVGLLCSWWALEGTWEICVEAVTCRPSLQSKEQTVWPSSTPDGPDALRLQSIESAGRRHSWRGWGMYTPLHFSSLPGGRGRWAERVAFWEESFVQTDSCLYHKMSRGLPASPLCLTGAVAFTFIY